MAEFLSRSWFGPAREWTARIDPPTPAAAGSLQDIFVITQRAALCSRRNARGGKRVKAAYRLAIEPGAAPYTWAIGRPARGGIAE